MIQKKLIEYKMVCLLKDYNEIYIIKKEKKNNDVKTGNKIIYISIIKYNNSIYLFCNS